MLKPFLAVAVLAVVAMVGLRYGWIRVAGLSGSCTQVAANPDGTALEACSRGRLQGWPDLGSQSCTFVRESGQWQYWHCPAPLVASQVGR